jgi:hypothetical protein
MPTTKTSEAEIALLWRIAEVIPASLRRERKALFGKAKKQALNPEERAELLRYINEIETREAERIMLIAEVAKLRGVRLQDIIHEFQPKPQKAPYI